MGKRIPSKNEIICVCGAYDHPHRLGGGTCDGSAWCVSFRSIDSFDCDTCNHNHAGRCDVVGGLEPLNNETCECLVGEIRSGNLRDEYGFLPLDFDAYMEGQYNEHYERQ